MIILLKNEKYLKIDNEDSDIFIYENGKDILAIFSDDYKNITEEIASKYLLEALDFPFILNSKVYKDNLIIDINDQIIFCYFWPKFNLSINKFRDLNHLKASIKTMSNMPKMIYMLRDNELLDISRYFDIK